MIINYYHILEDLWKKNDLSFLTKKESSKMDKLMSWYCTFVTNNSKEQIEIHIREE